MLQRVVKREEISGGRTISTLACGHTSCGPTATAWDDEKPCLSCGETEPLRLARWWRQTWRLAGEGETTLSRKEYKEHRSRMADNRVGAILRKLYHTT